MSELEQFLEFLELQDLIVGEPMMVNGRWEGDYEALNKDEILSRYAAYKLGVDKL